MDTSVEPSTAVATVPAPLAESVAVPARTASQPSSRVHGIDGLRAVAALWVVGFHMFAFSGGSVLPGLDFVLRSGSTGVSLFLVLSGLCLYLPYAGGRHARFTPADFFRRRMRRLLPAYYVSLVLVLLAHMVTAGRIGLPAYSPSEYAAQVVTHATLTHQLFPETFYGLNGAYWSLGLEWELYLTLPLLIVAAVRFGLPKVVATVFVATAAWRLGIFAAVQSGSLDGDGVWANVVAANFFLGRWSEFALGMLAAELYRTRRIQIRWPLIAGAVVAAVLALALPENPLNHMLFGVVFFTLVLTVLANDNFVARAFSWRPLVAVGVMSYSLYLVHQPIIEAMGRMLGDERGTDPRLVFLAMLAILPLLMLAAFALFATVEKRGMTAAGTPAGDLLFPHRRETAAAAPPQQAAASTHDPLPAATPRAAHLDDARISPPVTTDEDRA